VTAVTVAERAAEVDSQPSQAERDWWLLKALEAENSGPQAARLGTVLARIRLANGHAH
jgi:hypothetical protein